MILHAATVLACCFAMGGWFTPASPAERHLLVTDDNGRPLPEAKVDVAYKRYVNGLFLYEASRVTDRDGRCQVPADREDEFLMRVDGVHCPGYVFEDYLNPDHGRPLPPSAQCTAEHPFRLVMRKQGDEKYVPYSTGGIQGRLCLDATSPQDMPRALDVDLFELEASLADVPKYVDFTVTPHLDGDWRKCSVEFSTTNSGCGLLVTTNRVYTAPESGYTTRTNVTMDAYANEAFTLYLRTRSPSLYVMVIPDQVWGGRWTVKDGKPAFAFKLKSVDINLSGSRVLEPDTRFAKQKIPVDVYARRFLRDHRYLESKILAEHITVLPESKDKLPLRQRPSITRDVLVTDVEGQPLKKAKLTLQWSDFQGTIEDRFRVLTRKDRSKEVATDRYGRYHVPSGEDEKRSGFRLTGVACDGYCLDTDFNAGFKLPKGLTSYEKNVDPLQVVMRRQESEMDLPLRLNVGGGVRASREEAARGAKSADVNLFKNAQRQLGPDYVDFTMTPRYDAARRTWSVCFATTNAGSGIVVSPQCRYRAPETGYLPRVEAPVEDGSNTVFTLYLRTRQPTVYALVRLRGRFPDEKATTKDCSFHVEDCLVNLWGGRVFETDPIMRDDGSWVMRESWGRLTVFDPLPILVEHRYPKRPDAPAVFEAYRQKDTIDKTNDWARGELHKLGRLGEWIRMESRTRGTYSSELADLETREGLLNLEIEQRERNRIWLEAELWRMLHPETNAMTYAAYRKSKGQSEVYPVAPIPEAERVERENLLQNPPRSVQHILVVDEAGQPLPGADVSFAWEVVDVKKGTREPMSFHYRTGDLGRVMVNYDPKVSEHYRVETVDLPGYVFDKVLNPKLELPSFDQPLGSDKTPVHLVMRKQK